MQKTCIGLVLLATISLSQAADWPHWRGPNYDGISSEKGWSAKWPAEGPKQVWKASVGTGFSSVAIAKDRAYTMGNEKDTDTVYCLDVNTGKELWKHSYECALDAKYFEGGPTATPTVDGDRVYTLSRKGHMFCLDAGSGKVIWSTNVAEAVGAKPPTWGLSGSVLVQNNVLFVNAGTAGMALDKKSGSILWSSGKEQSGYSTPLACSIDGKPALTFFIKQAVVAVEPGTGKQIWSYPWKTSYDVNASQPIAVGNKVFISSGYDHGAALLEIKDGQPTLVWENKNMRNQINSSVLLDGFLYGVDGDVNKPSSALNCVELSTGTLKWSEKGLGGGALMVADKKLIVIGDKGELVVAEASPEKFKPISRAQVLTGKCWTVPVLANGKIYCRNAKGDLVCLDVKGN